MCRESGWLAKKLAPKPESVQTLQLQERLRHVHQAYVIEKDSFIWMVPVRDWRAFRREYENFCAELNRRNNQSLLRMVLNA